ncbi:hypothetical protein EST38_g1122 [Candolleomyces aberdarensis]|uniref:Rhodanese domain-containing protein n=1 Tax=Candolleomyces aberdarensis TaxID=2316362 RepID=A0A4Q2DWA0_9AGAR|nr:hypothetical protein EST38_g1122 [Candolleomyces aberdarensis]
MLRTAILRAARTTPQRAARIAVSYRPTVPVFVRYNSTAPPKTPEELAKKAALKERDAIQRDWDAKIISYEELLPKTQSPTPDTFLIDVREPDEVVLGMIPSAVNVPLSILPESLHLNAEPFKEKFNFDKPRHDQEVIFYCRSGKRSTTASDVAKRNGYKNILNYTGSWLEWTEKQNPKPTSA